MGKLLKMTPEEFERNASELVECWRANEPNQFAQQVIDLRMMYRKGVIVRLLNEVKHRLPPAKPVAAFKLFEPGDRVAAIDDIYAGGLGNQKIASANQEAIVADNNRMNSNNYITVQFDGDTHKVVANSSQFRVVGDETVENIREKTMKHDR